MPIGKQMEKPATSVTVHHPYPHRAPGGASIAQEIAQIAAIHRGHLQRGWQGIGYSFVVTQNGNIYEGRGWGRVGAHAGTTEGNETSYGIAFLIDGTKEVPSASAVQAFRTLRMQGIRDRYLTKGHTLKLHRDWKPSTDCPGDVLARAIRGATPQPERLLKLGVQGPDVQELQRLIGLPESLQTGYYGSRTERAVRDFQRANKLTPDGMAGPLTMAKLRGQNSP